MKKILSLVLAGLLLIFATHTYAQGKKGSSKSSSKSSSYHSGTYKGGKGSSHKGGKYKNSSTGIITGKGSKQAFQ